MRRSTLRVTATHAEARLATLFAQMHLFAQPHHDLTQFVVCPKTYTYERPRTREDAEVLYESVASLAEMHVHYDANGPVSRVRVEESRSYLIVRVDYFTSLSNIEAASE